MTDEEDAKLSLSRSKNLRNKEYILAAKFLTKRALNWKQLVTRSNPYGEPKRILKCAKREIMFFYLSSN